MKRQGNIYIKAAEQEANWVSFFTRDCLNIGRSVICEFSSSGLPCGSSCSLVTEIPPVIDLDDLPVADLQTGPRTSQVPCFPPFSLHQSFHRLGHPPAYGIEKKRAVTSVRNLRPDQKQSIGTISTESIDDHCAIGRS